MAIIYSCHAPEREWFFENLIPESSLLLFDPRLERTLKPIGDRFRELDEGARAVEAVVVRGDRELDLARGADPVFIAVIGSTPVFAMRPSSSGLGIELVQPAWSQVAVAPPLADLRAAEILALLETNGAILRQDGFHYALPSRVHAPEFVRVGEALYDAVDVSRIADWILPSLADGGGLLGDTGTMLALLFAVAAQAQEQFGNKVPVDTLAEYPADYSGVEAACRNLRDQECKRVVFVVSVNSTGRLVEIFNAVDPGPSEIVLLCDTAAAPSEEAAVLAHYPIERWPVKPDGSCEECDTLETLAVDAHTYTVRRDAPWKATRLRMTDALKHEAFWKMADGEGAIELHREAGSADDQSSRHHAVHVDVAPLLAVSEFRSRVLEQMRQHPSPDLVLIPEHGASEALAELAREAHPDLGEDSVQIIQRFPSRSEVWVPACKAKRVLILDDTMVTGRTLVGIRRKLYEATRAQGKSPEVRAFVILSRPENSRALQLVRVNYTAPARGEGEGILVSHFESVEEIYLPRKCSWCEERKRLEQLLRTLERGREEAALRARTLRGDGVPDSYLAEEPELRTEDSFLGALSPTAAFAAISSVTQEAVDRVVTARRGGQHTALDVELSIEAFYDPAILGGILRTAPKHVLFHPEGDKEINALLAEHGETLGVGCLAEIGWAAACAKVPPEGISEALARHEGSRRIEFLLEAIRVQHRSGATLMSESQPAPRG